MQREKQENIGRTSKRMAYLFMALLVYGLIASCTGKVEDSKRMELERDIVIIGLKGGIFGFFPNISNYESTTISLNSNIFDSLVSFDQDFRIVPSLAQAWENPQSNVWRFHLRRGVIFQDGSGFDAYDVKYTLESIILDETSALKDLLSSVESVSIIDNYTVDIRTREPFPVLLNKLVDIYIVSSSHNEGPQDGKPIGTGPYRLVRYETGDMIELERFESHWRGSPAIKRAIFKVIEDDSERIHALVLKQIDIAEQIPYLAYEEYREDQDVRFHEVASSRVIYLGFDFRSNQSYGFGKAPNPTSDLRVRKAIYQAIDTDRIREEVMHGFAAPASQFTSPEVFGYNPAIRRLPYDKDKSRELLEEAGYGSGFNITLDCPNNRYVNDELICRRISEQLKEVGIDVRLDIRPKADFFQKVLARNTSFYLLGWSADTGDGGEILDYLLTTVDNAKGYGTYNLGYYSNQRVDGLSKNSSNTLHAKERLRFIQDAFAIASEDVVWVPLHIQTGIYGAASDIDWKPRKDSMIRVMEME